MVRLSKLIKEDTNMQMTLTRKQLLDMGHNDITAGAELQAFIENTDEALRVTIRRIGESIQTVQRSVIDDASN